MRQGVIGIADQLGIGQGVEHLEQLLLVMDRLEEPARSGLDGPDNQPDVGQGCPGRALDQGYDVPGQGLDLEQVDNDQGVLGVCLGAGPPPPTCGPSKKCSKDGDIAEASAGRKPDEDLGLGTVSPLNKKEPLYAEGHRDTKRDIFHEAENEKEPSTPQGQDFETSKESTLTAMVMDYAEGRPQGFTLSHFWEDNKQSGHLRDTSRDTVKRTLNRMAGTKLAKIGKGQQALFCKPEYEESIRAACHSTQEQASAAKATDQTVGKTKLPRLKDLLIKKPQVPPQPMAVSWGQDLEKIISLRTGTVDVIGGSTDAGKTALVMDFIMRNMNRFSIRYFNWEMDEGELYDRLRLLAKYYDVSIDSFYDKVEFVDWYCDALDTESMNGLIHLIDPDKINIIDYLTANDEFYRIGGVLERIHNKLRNGIALVALQKDPEAKLPYGKGHTQKVARMALTLDPAPKMGLNCSHLRFTKAKGRVNKNINPTGVDIFLDIQEGAYILTKEVRYQGKTYKSIEELVAAFGRQINKPLS